MVINIKPLHSGALGEGGSKPLNLPDPKTPGAAHQILIGTLSQ